MNDDKAPSYPVLRFLTLFALDADTRPGNGVQPRERDFLFAIHANPVGALIESRKRGVNVCDPLLDVVLEGALRSLEICKEAGVKVGYGSDLLGQLQVEQSREFMFRAEVLKPIEIIRQATTVGAEILRHEGKLGVVEPGAFADLIVVDGNPLKKLELFLDQGAHLPVIMKAGKFHKNTLK